VNLFVKKMLSKIITHLCSEVADLVAVMFRKKQNVPIDEQETVIE
jgi:hypothetical protein